MKKIAHEIGNRVETAVDIKVIFKGESQKTVGLLKDATQLLESWYLVYMQVRPATPFPKMFSKGA